jgi:hypothetical protein
MRVTQYSIGWLGGVGRKRALGEYKLFPNGATVVGTSTLPLASSASRLSGGRDAH